MEIQINKTTKKKGEKKWIPEEKEEIQTNHRNQTQIKGDKEEETVIVEEEEGQEVTIKEVEDLHKVTQVTLLAILIVMMILVLQVEKIVEKQVMIAKESKLVDQDLVLKDEVVEMTIKKYKNSQSNKVHLSLWVKKVKIMIKIVMKEKLQSYKTQLMLV